MTKNYFDNDFVELKITEFQKTGDRTIIDELEPIFKKLIHGIISRYKLIRSNVINDDLPQEAWVGILEVLPKWNKERGDAFSCFTAVAKNKMLWYLKNNYKDTSLNSNDPSRIALDDENVKLELSTDVDQSFEALSAIRDFVQKLTSDSLDLPEDECYNIILESIKEKIVHGDHIIYENLIKETQKEIGHPKKKVRFVLDRIYAAFTGEL
jgi:DNA-directed RNA polymerase specialized sigma subunit